MADVALPVVIGRPDLFAVVRWWGPVLVYMILIFLMSANPIPEVFGGAPDYVWHVGGYFVLTLLAVRAFTKGLAHEPTNISVFAAFVLTILYGISDEWHQGYVSDRDSSLVDLVANGVGALLAIGTLSLFWKIRGGYQSE